MRTATKVVLMPRQALYSKAFGAMVSELVGDLSLEQAGIRAGLAGETIRKMKGGKIPEPATLEAFAAGFADRGADLQTLRIAAGYETDAKEAFVVKAFRTAQRAGAEERFMKLAEEILREEREEQQKEDAGP